MPKLGRPKNATDYSVYDYYIAQQIAQPINYVPESELSLTHPDISPEAKVLKADLYHKLSDEAKEVIDVVVNRPVIFLKFVWRNDPWYSEAIYYSTNYRRLKRNPVNDFPRHMPKRNNKSSENRMTNIHVIKLFFLKKWKKSPKFVDGVINEIRSFVKVL